MPRPAAARRRPVSKSKKVVTPREGKARRTRDRSRNPAISSASAPGSISSVLKEKRLFPPSQEFSSRAHIHSETALRKLHREAQRDPVAFWEQRANDLHWFKKWKTALKWKAPFAEWFVGGKLNISYNCLDRHVASWRRNKAALVWESEQGEVRTLTYHHLLTQVNRLANVLKSLGVQKGGCCRDLYGDGSRGGNRNACLCSDRRDAQRGVRRILL